MGVSYFILKCCGEIWADCWGDYKYCEDCGEVVCEDCLLAWNEDWYEKFYDEDSGELSECLCCDQFRHMTPEYSP